MADDRKDTGTLDALLAEAAGQRPGDDLVARVLRDAEAVQADQTARARPAPSRSGLWRDPPGFVAALGGWGGLGGVTAAGLVGLAVGFWSPDLVNTIGAGGIPFFGGGSDWAPDLTGLALESDDA